MAHVTVEHDASRQRWTALVAERVVGWVHEEEAPGLVVLTRTEVDEEHRGQGVATALVRGVVDDVRARGGLQVQARCPFVAQWFDRHPDEQDLLAEV